MNERQNSHPRQSRDEEEDAEENEEEEEDGSIEGGRRGPEERSFRGYRSVEVPDMVRSTEGSSSVHFEGGEPAGGRERGGSVDG